MRGIGVWKDESAMIRIQPTPNEHNWPRHAVPTVEARKRDLVIRIADWTRQKEEPSYDVECYIGGVYDWNESKTFVVNGSKQAAKQLAIEYAAKQIAKLL